MCGASEATRAQLDAAREVGRLLAESGAIKGAGTRAGVRPRRAGRLRKRVVIKADGRYLIYYEKV